MNIIDDYYEILGVSSDSTIIEIKKAIKQKTVKFYPNKINFEEYNKDNEIKLATEAYNVLYNYRSRQLYDKYKSIKLYNKYCDENDNKRKIEIVNMLNIL